MSASILQFTAPPVVVVRPIGHAFATTVARSRSGAEVRHGIFSDPARRQATLINNLIREAQL